MRTFCREVCKNGLTDQAVLVVDSGGPKEAHVQSYSPDDGSVHNFSHIRQVAPVYLTTLCPVSCAKMAEVTHLPFALWTSLGRQKHKFSRIRQVAPMCPHVRAQWHHLVNAVEPSVCGDDGILCQITLTTCLYVVGTL